MKIQDILNFYCDVVQCDSCCPDIRQSRAEGNVPRGFGPSKSGITKILVVGKNPGHLMPDEKPFYLGKSSMELVKAILGYTGDNNTDSLSKRFHANLYRYLGYLLGIDKDLRTYREYQQILDKKCYHDSIDQWVSFTNLFKCSTLV